MPPWWRHRLLARLRLSGYGAPSEVAWSSPGPKPCVSGSVWRATRPHTVAPHWLHWRASTGRSHRLLVAGLGLALLPEEPARAPSSSPPSS